jgi:hypothetical protein
MIDNSGILSNLDSALGSQKNMVTEWAHSQGRMVSYEEAGNSDAAATSCSHHTAEQAGFLLVTFNGEIKTSGA